MCEYIEIQRNSNYCQFDRSERFPERDIWSLHVMDQGSCQIGRVLGTPPPPSPGSPGWHSGRGTMFGVFKLEFDSYESSRNFETEVLHRNSSRIDLAEWFGLGSRFGKNVHFVSISPNQMFIFWETLEIRIYYKQVQNVKMHISTISAHPKFKFSENPKKNH